jgi:hypothetical protein
MKTQEILNFEQAQSNLITLMKDGMFWRAYDQSAFLLINHFWPGLKVNGGPVQAAGGKEVYYVGFPDASLKKVLDRIPEVGDAFLMEQTNNRISIANVPHIDGFEEWKKGLALLREQAADQMQPYYGQLPLYKAVYDLFFHVITLTRQFPKDMQYTVGGKMIAHVLGINDLLYKLLKTEKKYQTKELELDAVSEKIILANKIEEMVESLRFLLRASFDLKLYNVERFAELSDRIESVRKQLYGWQKKTTVA